MDDVMMQIIKLLITIAGLAITYYLVPFLKKKVGEKKFDEIYNLVAIAVNAAEQIFNQPNMGEKKKEYVIKFLEEKGIDITDEQIDALIEAVVYEINRYKS
jgi:LL-H family phage holin